MVEVDKQQTEEEKRS